MAEKRWTDGQLDAMSARRGTVLVAAAAGSGKTEVLVQRAIQRLTDPENPTDADKLLVVTFTKDAAAGMRERLERRFRELLQQRPGDARLQRQSILLTQAHIGTVDSFCAEIDREFFHLLGIAPDFKVLPDERRREMMSSALSEAVADAYSSGAGGVLADAFSGARDDSSLLNMVTTIYDYMQSHPFPEQWLQEKTDMYFPGKGTLPAGQPTPWQQVILEYVGEAAAHCSALLDRGIQELAESEPLEAAFRVPLEQDRECFHGMESLAAAGDWDGLREAVLSFKQASARSPKGFGEDPLALRVKAVRSEVKDTAKELSKYLEVDNAACARETAQAAPLVKGIQDLVLDFSRRYDEKKRQGGFLDFSDLEHCAIRLFLEPDGSPTPAAREVSQRFDEIMIDEYQDINEVQDSLFRAISRDGRNLFMVGDVKQSIYGFRQAMPEIFLRCRESYEPYDRQKDAYPAAIALDRNFRSRREVTDTVNFIFSLLMTKQAGDMDYTGDERLVCGADYPPKEGCETELQFIARDRGTTAEQAEGAWLAQRIRQMVEEGFSVTDRDGERPCDYGDFCILLRSANKHAHGYAQELQKHGVPARASVAEGFFQAAEIRFLLSLLEVIENPNQDIPLLSVLMSPLYGFTADDAARLRSQSRDVSVYISLTRQAETDPRCAKILEDLSRYRSVAATMASDAFLNYLYSKTGYQEIVLAMEDGETRLENLRLLEKKARDYEGSGYRGVAGFVRFLGKLREEQADLQAAERAPQGHSAVTVMSVHKSKGLEFPVCILAGCGRDFSSNSRGQVLLHGKLGIGVKLRDGKRSAQFTTTAREAIGLENDRAGAAEELRILYVALTRAKEKLILVGSGENPMGTCQKMALALTARGPAPYTVRGAKNAAQWLLLCALCHPDGGDLRQETGAPAGCITTQDYTPWKIGFSRYEAGEEQEEARPAPQAPDLELLRQLQENAARTYPYQETVEIPAKVAASKLAAERAGEEEITLSRPAWLGEQGMTPAERGTALHAFMQFADFSAFQKDPEGERRRLVDMALLTPEQGEAVDLRRVERFLESDLGQRVLRSSQVEKERRFTAVIPASLAQPGAGDGEDVILQGAVDCTFVEDGKLYVIDFKTDRVREMEELWARYEAQLQLYGFAMEEVTGLPVGGLYLYSTWLNQESSRPRE